VPKCEGDKKQQHQSDFNDTKRLLEEARQRKLAEMKAAEEKKKKEKQLILAAQKVQDGSPAQRSSKKQRNNSTDLRHQRSVQDTNSDTSDGEWSNKDEKPVNRSISRKRQRSGKKRLSTSSEEDSNLEKSRIEQLNTSKVCVIQISKPKHNCKYKVNYFVHLHFRYSEDSTACSVSTARDTFFSFTLPSTSFTRLTKHKKAKRSLYFRNLS